MFIQSIGGGAHPNKTKIWQVNDLQTISLDNLKTRSAKELEKVQENRQDRLDKKDTLDQSKELQTHNNMLVVEEELSALLEKDRESLENFDSSALEAEINGMRVDVQGLENYVEDEDLQEVDHLLSMASDQVNAFEHHSHAIAKNFKADGQLTKEAYKALKKELKGVEKDVKGEIKDLKKALKGGDLSASDQAFFEEILTDYGQVREILKDSKLGLQDKAKQVYDLLQKIRDKLEGSGITEGTEGDSGSNEIAITGGTEDTEDYSDSSEAGITEDADGTAGTEGASDSSEIVDSLNEGIEDITQILNPFVANDGRNELSAALGFLNQAQQLFFESQLNSRLSFHSNFRNLDGIQQQDPDSVAQRVIKEFMENSAGNNMKYMFDEDNQVNVAMDNSVLLNGLDPSGRKITSVFEQADRIEKKSENLKANALSGRVAVSGAYSDAASKNITQAQERSATAKEGYVENKGGSARLSLNAYDHQNDTVVTQELKGRSLDLYDSGAIAAAKQGESNGNLAPNSGTNITDPANISG